MARSIEGNCFPAFLLKKKSDKRLQLEIDNQVKLLASDPETGELKKGDLSGIRVHNFTLNSQHFLLAYERLEDELRLESLSEKYTPAANPV